MIFFGQARAHTPQLTHLPGLTMGKFSTMVMASNGHASPHSPRPMQAYWQFDGPPKSRFAAVQEAKPMYSCLWLTLPSTREQRTTAIRSSTAVYLLAGQFRDDRRHLLFSWKAQIGRHMPL